jgi:hypothetical protein
MSTAATVERMMLDLINAERAREGVDPLRLEQRLNDSAEDHSAWTLAADTFSHIGANGSSPTARLRDAGFKFQGSWSSGENIAWQSERGRGGIADDVAQLHASLMNSPGHRANILSPNFELVGIGVERGDFKGYDGVVVTQNFARTSAPVRLDPGPAPAPAPEPAPTSPPSTLPTGSTGPDTITVRVSGDAYKGDPNFALTLNGRVLDASNRVVADRGEGEWETLVFRGDFNLDGTDRVGVQFTNDHYEGSSSRDRNLYVDAVTANGETNGQNHTFFRAETAYWDI